MDIAITGNYNKSTLKAKRVHKVLRPGYKLYVGTECNDGRPITESWRYKQAQKLGIPIVKKAPVVAADVSTYEKKEMFVDKYSPSSISDIIGHKEQINQIATWLQSWSNGVNGVPPPDVPRGILVTGPPGIGKTTTVHLIAKELGYKVAEYNASDTRSISVLRGLIALGIKRLVKEVIVMDEIDGLSERGGVGEIAAIIKKTQTPIICIANEKPPKLKPIINSCLDIKFNRPMKSTIATSLLKVAKAEGITINKLELEGLCEKNGNDIRSILNNLEFYGSEVTENKNDKDATHRLDLFSATQKLMGNKRISLDEASNLVFVDYGMVPLMVQEAYIGASRDPVKALEDCVAASEMISFGDMIDHKVHTTQDWNLLPHYVAAVASAARTVSGPAPFQIFPSWLGKNSKRMKHKRLLDDMSLRMNCTPESLRLDYASPLQSILTIPLQADKPDIKGVIKMMDEAKITRDDLMETLQEVVLEKVEIPTKTKTAFTREYNKTHDAKDIIVKKRKIGTGTAKTVMEISDEEGEEEGEQEQEQEQDIINEIEEGVDMLEI